MATGIRLQALADGVIWQERSDGLVTPSNSRQIYVYRRGTTTQVAVFQDAALTVPYPGGQPLSTGADGRPGAVPGYIAAEVAIDFVDVASGEVRPAEPLAVADLVVDSATTGGASDGSVHVSKYLATGLYANPTAAVQAAHDALPSTGGRLVFPATDAMTDGKLVLDNVSINKHLVIEGVYRRTQLDAGASGTIFTIDQSGSGQGGSFSIRDMAIGDTPGAAVVNRPYDKPLIWFKNFSTWLDLKNLIVNLSGTGTVFRFSSCGNLRISGGYIKTGFYGVSYEFDDTANPSFLADTITIDDGLIWGLHGVIFRQGPEGSTPGYSTVEFRGKILGTTAGVSQASLDDTLSYTVGFGEVAAGATQIQVASGAWAVNDAIYLEGNFATDGATRTGGTAEVNKVTAVTGAGPYVLTLAQPLRYAHGTNAGAFHVQALRGGVGLSLTNDMQVVGASHYHAEELQFGVIDYGVKGSEYHRCSKGATDALVRFAGACQDAKFGLTYCAGRGGNNRIVDIPAWNTSLGDRFEFLGPWENATPTVADSGVDLALDSLHSGAILATKTYTTAETIAGRVRTSHHLPTGAGGQVRMRFGSGASPDALDILANGQLVGGSHTGDMTTLAYSASITPVATTGHWQKITVTNNSAMTINAPTSPPTSAQTREMTIEVKNSSGGAMGVITWNAAFVFAGLSWTNPANGKSRYARFEWNGTVWVCTSLASADY